MGAQFPSLIEIKIPGFRGIGCLTATAVKILFRIYACVRRGITIFVIIGQAKVSMDAIIFIIIG